MQRIDEVIECPVHGVVTQPGPLQIGTTGPGVTIGALWASGTVTRCAACGQVSKVIDAKWEPSSSGGLFLAEMKLTMRQREMLKRSLKWAEQELERSDPDQERAVRVLEKTIEANAPAAKPWISKMGHDFRGNVSGWTAVLVAVVTLLVSLNTDPGVSGDELERILDETVRSVQNEPTGTSDEAPTPLSPATVRQVEPPIVSELPTPKTH